MAGLLVRGATVVPVDGPEHAPLGTVRRADLRIGDDRIEALGALAPQPGDTVLDAAGLVALPGLVQGHVHFCQTLFRGLCDDLPLLDWLRQRIWPLEHAHDAASVDASARLSMAELLRGGTTTVQVMESVRHAEASFAAAGEVGMTVILGNCLMDRAGDGVPAGMATSPAEALRLCEQLRAAYHGRGRLHYAVSPRFVLSCSDGLAREAAAFAHGHGLRIHSHACEHPAEVAEVQRQLGRSTIAALADQGLLGPRTGLAHCVHTSEAERAALVDSGTAVLHCPSTNLKLGSGLAPVADYHARGLRVALGADGAPCNNRLSAWTEMRQAALLQALVAGPGAWPAAQALYAATRGGATALGLEDDVGSLAPGKRADVVLCDLRELQPGGDMVSQLVYSASDAHVRHVVLGGEVVVRDGVLLRLDAEAVRARAAEALAAVQRRADL